MLIKINLLGERKKKGAKTLLWLGTYAAILIICVLGFSVAIHDVGIELADKESQVSLLDAQLVKLKVVTKEVDDLKQKKNTLMEKIAVMAALKKRKSGPVRVLNDLNNALPEKAWLSEIKESEGGILKITGYALDNQTNVAFMKALEQSEYFPSVEPVEAKQVRIKDVGVKEFTLQTKINYLGKMVPDQSPIVMPSVDADPNKPAPSQALPIGQ